MMLDFDLYIFSLVHFYRSGVPDYNTHTYIHIKVVTASCFFLYTPIPNNHSQAMIFNYLLLSGGFTNSLFVFISSLSEACLKNVYLVGVDGDTELETAELKAVMPPPVLPLLNLMMDDQLTADEKLVTAKMLWNLSHDVPLSSYFPYRLLPYLKEILDTPGLTFPSLKILLRK